MFNNTLLQDIRENGLPSSAEPGLEGISDFFMPLFNKLGTLFGDVSFREGFSGLFEGKEPTLMDDDLSKLMERLGYESFEKFMIPIPANLSKDFPGYAKKLAAGIEALSNVDTRIIKPVTLWLNNAVMREDGIEKLLPRVYPVDLDNINKGIKTHFNMTRVSERGPEATQFGNLYRNNKEFITTGVELKKLDTVFFKFNYESLINAEEKLLEAIKRFSNYESPVTIDPKIRLTLIDALRQAGEELETLSVLIYSAKVASENYKLCQTAIKEAFGK